MYDFTNDRRGYITRCLNELKNVPDDFLNDLLRLDNKKLHAFRSKYNLSAKQFTKNDVRCVAYCKKIIRKISKKQHIVCSDENMSLLAKFMTKRYILYRNTGKRVTCHIYVDDCELCINRYNYHHKDNTLQHTYVSGCIDIGEDQENALHREMKEELCMTFPFDRYELLCVTENAHNYALHITNSEYMYYVKTFNPCALDPEITRITLMEKLIY